MSRSKSCVVREIARGDRPDRHATCEYLGSQPWPFPRSLMVGFHALGDPEQEFSFNDGEIAEAAWFTRDEVREALDARRLEQRFGVETAAARLDLDRPRDHRVLGGARLTRPNRQRARNCRRTRHFVDPASATTPAWP